VHAVVFCINVLVKNPDPVLEWVRENVPRHFLVRWKARGVNIEKMKAGAIIAFCDSTHSDFGWMVTIVVKDRENAEKVKAYWSPSVDRCDIWP
jgi:hypothetical protein